MDSLIGNLFILALLLWILGKSASWALRSAVGLSRMLEIPEVVISLVIVTLISILPETTIAIISAFQGAPSLGLGTLLGSNVADLTFVFGVAALVSAHQPHAQKIFLQKDYQFLGLLLLPLILGFGGSYSRLDGMLLIAGGVGFFLSLARANIDHRRINHAPGRSALHNAGILFFGLLVMSASAYGAVVSAQSFAERIGFNPALVGLLVVALGTTLPELMFSLRALKKGHSALAVGDVMGTVIADATIVIGITALIHPFSFNPRLVILTGSFMLLAGLFVLSLFRSGKEITRIEGGALLAFYAAFVIVEFILRDWTPLVIQ